MKSKINFLISHHISLRLTTLLLSISIMGACTPKNQNQNSNAFKVGIVLDKGGRDDKSFNTAAVLGAQKAEKELHIETKIVESPDDTAYEPAIRALAERGYPLVIVIGFSQKDPLIKVAPQFPQTKFAIVDSQVDFPNVRNLMFAEHEGSFLIGMASALKSKTGVVGFIGGMEIDLIRRFELGFKEGVYYVNPKAKVLVNYVGVTGDAWVNPSKGKELALTQYGQNADVIFHAAGASGMGVFDAAEQKKLYAVGVDSNQDYIKPGFILTSMLKKVDAAVYQTIKDAMEQKFTNGTVQYGLSNGGVDFSQDEYNKNILDAKIIEKLNQAKQDIISKKIKVSDYYVTKKMK